MMQKSGQTFLARLCTPTFVQFRPMSTAATIQARFEKAYQTRAAQLASKPRQR